MSKCTHPMEWRLRLKQVNELFMKQINEKQREDEIIEQERLAELGGYETESSVDWNNWDVIQKGLRGDKCDKSLFLADLPD